MRAQDVLPDGVNEVEINGCTVRKGSVAAFLANAAIWVSADAGEQARATAEQDIEAAVPALVAVGLFEVMEIRHPRLRAFVEARR
jgi:hypothetical protein